ncbi:MAG: hypothetical protein JST37_04300 [Bacteroidetes bacterium]|nr:hypothetical protein [Bacteroidota bacterium]MBS1980809.1 hypothetical protein [Bacteroidota bacterium]
MKIFLGGQVSIFFLTISVSVNCQNLTFLGGLQTAFPNGNLKYSAGIGVGVFGKFDYRLTERLSAIASIDGISFSQKSTTLNIIPTPIEVKTKVGIETLQLGGRFNLVKGIRGNLYVSSELGVSETRFNITGNGNTATTNDYYFCYQYGLGYSLKRWDARWSQQFISSGSNSLNFFALQLGYLMRFK